MGVGFQVGCPRVMVLETSISAWTRQVITHLSVWCGPWVCWICFPLRFPDEIEGGGIMAEFALVSPESCILLGLLSFMGFPCWPVLRMELRGYCVKDCVLGPWSPRLEYLHRLGGCHSSLRKLLTVGLCDSGIC